MAKRKFYANEFEVRGDVTALSLFPTDGKKYETLIDTADLEYVLSLGLCWNLRRDVNTNGFYVLNVKSFWLIVIPWRLNKSFNQLILWI